MKPTVILGIETSCDETAAAIVIDGNLVAEMTTTQVLHQRYGGVVPELASRAHEQLLLSSVEKVIEDAGVSLSSIDLVAATSGPGLAGALLVGVSFAKGLASSLSIPWLGVNHIEGHIWSIDLTDKSPRVPFLVLIASGGHTFLSRVDDFGEYKKLGSTRDDAVGELFDKIGRMLGYGFPAGAELDRDALSFKGEAVRFPRARLKDDPLGFSFSGIKTAVLYHLRERYERDGTGFAVPVEDRTAIAAGLMQAVSDMLTTALNRALSECDYNALLFAGGVASSEFLGTAIKKVADTFDVPLFIPPRHHCTDNGAMIANIGYRRFRMGERSAFSESIDPAANLFTLK